MDHQGAGSVEHLANGSTGSKIAEHLVQMDHQEVDRWNIWI
jgi:hypothetical protein